MILKSQNKREFGWPTNLPEEKILPIKYFKKHRPPKGRKMKWAIGTRTKITDCGPNSIIKYLCDKSLLCCQRGFIADDKNIISRLGSASVWFLCYSLCSIFFLPLFLSIAISGISFRADIDRKRMFTPLSLFMIQENFPTFPTRFLFSSHWLRWSHMTLPKPITG